MSCVKPATHLAILYADRGDVAILKSHVIKFAAINVENCGDGHTWRMLANLISDI